MLNIIDKNKIHNNMVKLLSEYDYKYSDSAIDEIINAWAENKEGLIELLRTNPDWREEELAIVTSSKTIREVNRVAIINFREYILTSLNLYKDEIPKELIERRKEQNCRLLPAEMYDIIYRIPEYNVFLSEYDAKRIAEIFPESHAHAGQKTCRVFNKIFCYLGLDKDGSYNRNYAKYADALSPITIERTTVISVNPLDYLTMSFGNSWASCHTIDKNNRRGMPNNYSGCYSSGTLSYMLDESSIVLYTVDDKATENYWTCSKITREMFHYQNEKLIQGRLYPQDNDSGSPDYKTNRNLMQEIIAQALDKPNMWTLRQGCNACGDYVWNSGTHYRDYDCYENCTISLLKGSNNTDSIHVGHDPICPNCGSLHSVEDNILCESCNGTYYCEQCGERIDNEDDVIWIDGDPYCRDCVNYCEHCDSYTLSDLTYIRGTGEYVCDSCLDDYCLCDDCGEYFDEDDLTEVADGDLICSNCLERHYYQCDKCGEYFTASRVNILDNGKTLCDDCYEEYRKENDEEEDN